MRRYFRDLFRAIYTIAVGMRITLRYAFAAPVTLQYPDAPAALQARFRGFHFFEIEKCIACDLCAKACPVDCIYIEKTGPRKIDKSSGVARGGALERFAIDYSKCMFCALCIEPCPTDCIHMGEIHDMSAFDRASMVVEFTDLARRGLQTPQPLWMQREHPPEWARQRREAWVARGAALHDEMLKALEESQPARPDASQARPAVKPSAGLSGS